MRSKDLRWSLANNSRGEQLSARMMAGSLGINWAAGPVNVHFTESCLPKRKLGPGKDVAAGTELLPSPDQFNNISTPCHTTQLVRQLSGFPLSKPPVECDFFQVVSWETPLPVQKKAFFS